MKALFVAGAAVLLAGSPARSHGQAADFVDPHAAEDQMIQNSLIQQLLDLATQARQPLTPAGNARPPGEKTGQNPLVQQYLRVATQAVTEIQRQSTRPDSAHSSDDQTLKNPLVQQLLHLAMQEVAQIQRQLNLNDAIVSGNSPDGSVTASDLPDGPADSSAPTGRRPVAEAPETGTASSASTPASDGPLTTGSLQTGTLQTGTLHTGTLQTGRLSTDHLPSASPTTSVALPLRSFATPILAFVNAPPVDPDGEMCRWSRQIDLQYATEQAARRAALRLYPELAVAKSAFNTQFLARYSQYRQADPFGFLRGPGWPVKLAIFTEGDLQRQRSGLAMTP